MAPVLKMSEKTEESIGVEARCESASGFTDWPESEVSRGAGGVGFTKLGPGKTPLIIAEYWMSCLRDGKHWTQLQTSVRRRVGRPE